MLFARLKKHPNDAHLKASYNRFRNSVNKNTRHSMKNYYSSYFDSCKNNMRKIWKGVNEIVTSKNSTCNVNHLRHNQFIDDPKIISETFNNFFVNVGTTFISPTSYLKHSHP